MKKQTSIFMEIKHKCSRPGIFFGLLFALSVLLFGSIPAKAMGLSAEAVGLSRAELAAAASAIPHDGNLYEITVNEDDLLHPTVSDPVLVDRTAVEARFGHAFPVMDPGSAVQGDAVRNCRSAILNGLINRQDTIDVSRFKLTFDQVEEILDDIKDNEVRLVWWDHSMYSYGGMGAYCQYVSSLSYRDEATTNALLENIALALTESVAEDMTDLQKAISIYEWLCTNVEYDYTYEGHHIQHALIDRCCVCQGYAETYHLLCRWVGVDAGFASGNNHMWNSVKVNGTWYAVDCTWDADNGTIPGGVGHRYILRSDSYMSSHSHIYAGRDHECNDTSWDEDINYWTDIQSKHTSAALFLFDGSGAYYLKWQDENTCNVIFRSEATGAESVIKTLTVASEDFQSLTWNYTFYQGVSMARVGDLLFFNDNDHVYSYQPSTGTLSTYFTYTNKATPISAIYGVRNYKGSLVYKYGDLKDPETGRRMLEETGDVDTDYFFNFRRNRGTGELPYPDVTITWDDMDIDPIDPGISGFVRRLYRVFLDRNASAEEVRGWSDQLVSGSKTAGEVAAGFIFSPEFQNRNLCNDHYLEYLYRGLFDRPADEGGFTGWLRLIDEGYSRERVAQGFLTSPEFQDLCESFGVTCGTGLANVPTYGTIQKAHCTIAGCGNEAPVVILVRGLYDISFQRVPSQEEVDFWVDLMAAHRSDVTARVMVNSFLNGEEYSNLNRNNGEYVRDLYKAIFNRLPDEEGYAYWVEKLESGTYTREKVLNGFTSSQEFLDQCNHSGIEVGGEV